jgi:hypothetical protein
MGLEVVRQMKQDYTGEGVLLNPVIHRQPVAAVVMYAMVVAEIRMKVLAAAVVVLVDLVRQAVQMEQIIIEVGQVALVYSQHYKMILIVNTAKVERAQTKEQVRLLEHDLERMELLTQEQEVVVVLLIIWGIMKQ